MYRTNNEIGVGRYNTCVRHNNRTCKGCNNETGAGRNNTRCVGRNNGTYKGPAKLIR